MRIVSPTTQISYLPVMDETTINDIFQDLEEDPFNPYEYEMSTSEIIYTFVLVYLVSTVHIILCISILASNGLFFYVMVKFKRLRTRTNYILLNLFICVTFFSICVTGISIIESYFHGGHQFAFVFLLTFGFLDAAFLFALLLAIEWVLSANCCRIFTIYKKIYKLIIVTIYFVVVANVVPFVLLHHYVLIHIMSAFCGLIYLLCILGLAVLNIVKMRKTYSPEALKTLYALSVSNVFFLMWLPFVSVLVIGVLSIYLSTDNFSFPTIVILACLAYLAEFVAISAPIVIVVLLGKLDRNFKMSYDYIFKRSVRSYLQSDTNLDEEN